MNKIIENKILYIFGATKLADISLNSIKNLFIDLSGSEDSFDSEHCHQQVVDLWESKHGPILIL